MTVTLSSEIIKRGSIECGQCRGVPVIRRVAHIKKDLIEVEACPGCLDPEYNLEGKLVQTGEIELMDHLIFGDAEREIDTSG